MWERRGYKEGNRVAAEGGNCSCRLRGIGRWWEKKIGRTEEEVCSKCGEEEQTPDHIAGRSEELGTKGEG